MYRRALYSSTQGGVLWAGLLIVAGLALPWDGWEGLRTVALGLGLLGAAASGAGRRWRWARAVSGALGLAAVGLIAWRLAVAPSASLPGEPRSIAALLLGLVGGLAVVATALPGSIAVRRISLQAEQRAALRAVWRATWNSRLLVWTAGMLGALELGLAVHSPPTLSRPFGSFGNLLTAPGSAWDAGNYLLIAQGGYGALPHLRAYFPLYPVLIRAGAWTPQAALVLGILISMAAFVIAMYLLYRLMALERGRREADLLVLLVAFFPMAFFFSAVYTESLFLALSVGSFYAARRGWWSRAGIAGGLAAATRITGVLLVLPLLVLCLYGPREDRPPRADGVPARYPLNWSVACLALIPLGTLAYLAYMGAHGDLLGPLHAEHTYFGRQTVPVLGAVHGLLDAIRSVGQIVAGPHSHILAPAASGELRNPMKLAASNLVDFGFFVFACVAAIGALRRLPLAYGIYAVAAIVVTVSSYLPHEPLNSFPRYAMTIFPCLMWLAVWASERRRQPVTLALCAGLLAYFSAQFASWHWVS